MAWAGEINKQKYAEFDDWRIPTIAEYKGIYEKEGKVLAYDSNPGTLVGYP